MRLKRVRLDSVYLFRSDEILLTDVLTAACQNWFWETVEPEESFFEGDPLYYLIYCTLDEGEICFEVATGGGERSDSGLLSLAGRGICRAGPAAGQCAAREYL